MSNKLADMFRQSRGAPVALEGREIRREHQFVLPAGAGLQIRVLSHAARLRQSVHARIAPGHDGELSTASGISGIHLVVRAGKAAASPWVLWSECGDPTEVRLWNTWRDTHIAGEIWGLNEGGIHIEWKTAHWWVLHCSAGRTLDFEQMVIDVRVIGPDRFQRPHVTWLTRFLNRLPF